MKLIRIIEYEGDIDWLINQIGRSLPDGRKEVTGGSIVVVTVGNSTMLEVYKAYEESNELNPNQHPNL